MTILEKIFAAKRSDIKERKSRDLADAKAKASDQEPTRDFHQTLLKSPHQPSLIAEVKKASPSQGLIRPDFDPVSIAQTYDAVGADCLSVLTDIDYFQGSPRYLQEVRRAVTRPILRKDFTTDELDVYEARAMGADAILLIVAGLDRTELTDLSQLAESLTMDALVEVHSQAEAQLALELPAKLIGVNNRDLATFETSLSGGASLLSALKGKATLVGESAIHQHRDVESLHSAGARSVLIGTAFCREPHIDQAVKRIMNWQ